MVMTLTEDIFLTHLIYTQHFRITVCQPVRTRAGRSGKKHINSIFIQVVDDFFHPFKIIYSLFRLQFCPCKNTK